MMGRGKKRRSSSSSISKCDDEVTLHFMNNYCRELFRFSLKHIVKHMNDVDSLSCIT